MQGNFNNLLNMEQIEKPGRFFGFYSAQDSIF